MLDAALQALGMLLDPYRFAMLSLGVAIGIVIGIIPLLGPTFGMALVLPFIFGMEPYAAIAMAIGLIAVSVTSDSITSILFGIPGTAASAATIVDGYPMAKKGEAGRAMGAAFIASMLGGLIGAVVLTLSIPIARPLLLMLGSPELFMLCVLGISSVSVLSGRRPLTGLISGAMGLILASIGAGYGAAELRYTFDQAYLWAGIPLVVLVMGIFALPELIDLIIQGTTISAVPLLGKGFLEGAKDVFRNWGLVLRCSAIGVYIGIIPALGNAVAQWLAYGHVVQSCKDKENFGKGDVRGVIGPESTNNATAGGALVPTIFFGIPGSSVMALVLVAFIILGFYPGPDMVTKNLPFTFTIIWSLALANVMAAGICFALAQPLARITTIRVQYWMPLIILLVIIGAFQSTSDWGDLVALLSLGVLGWVMKRMGWARPPLVVGFVLGRLLEKYLTYSVSVYGAVWLLFPGVITIGILTVVSLWMGIAWQRRRKV